MDSAEECHKSLQKALPPGKIHHAFFCYASQSKDWVKGIIKKLETDHGFVCCEYDRDYNPGISSIEFSHDSIRNAYKTVVVMTKGAFQSVFFQHLIHIAILHGLDEQRNCIVPVLVEDCEIPGFLRDLNYVDARDTSKSSIWWPKLLMELEFQAETPAQAESMRSVQIVKQDFPMSSEDFEQFEQLKKALEAGTGDDSTVCIVDTIKEKGSEILKTRVLKYLSKQLENKMTLTEKQAKVKIWPGTNLSTGEITFVCVHQGKLETKLTDYFNIDISYNDTDKVAPEEEMGNQDSDWTMLKEEDALLITSAIDKHGDRLFSEHSNLQMVCGGPLLVHERQGINERVPTVIIYCHGKGIKPYGENEFPSQLTFDGKIIPVDIREGYFALAFGDHWYPDLCMGISIGEMGRKEFGTLGPFVNLSGEHHGFITCAHVVGTEGTHVVQPSDQDRGKSTVERQRDNICGRVLRRVHSGSFSIVEDDLTKIVGMDAALVELNGTRQEVPGRFQHISQAVLNAVGINDATRLQYDDGNCQINSDVIKCGRTTGITRGRVVLKGTMLRPLSLEMQYDDTTSFVMKGIHLIDGIHPRRRFAEKGDSGSGIFKTNGNNTTLSLVGLVLGNVVAKNDTRCVMLPVNYVLSALGISPDELLFLED